MIGIVACFCGVLLMAEADPNNDDAYNVNNKISDISRMIGFLLMCVVAANDGMVAVLARRMHSIHFSVMMYWFAALGLAFTSTSLVLKMIITQAIPTFLMYNSA
jgi:hypothetical protein